MASCSREARAFARACHRVEDTQTELLRDLVRRNAYTEFGRRHGFHQIRTASDYQASVPLTRYEDYAESIEKIGRGVAGVLTSDPVTLLQPTSGTSGAEKLIPYTQELRAQYQRAIAAWIADLFKGRPAVRRGRAYWSISPDFGEDRHTPCGIPIGFDDDTAYLGRLERIAIQRLLAAPPCVRSIPDLQALRYCTLLSLLRAPDLSLISVWSPSFLTTLLEPLESWSDRLCSDIRRGGGCDPPLPTRVNIPPEFARRNKADPRRANQFTDILRQNAPASDKLSAIWPRLALISCWTDAAARRQAERLRQLFPSVEIQPKGLLATEGVVSFPLVDRPGAALALRSHFFEFEEVASSRIRLAHELEPGESYRVIITTGGGLYRYQLRDEIEIVGFEKECPLLRFIGKADMVSDLAGEKLSEPHVRASLDTVFAARGLNPRFAMLAPTPDPLPRYCLYVQDPMLHGEAADLLAQDAQRRLESNPHYRYAVQLGQLRPLRVVVLDPYGESAWSVYERGKMAMGHKAGDIKPMALDRGLNWEKAFEPLAVK